jgi:hypothetical protein
LNRNEHWEGVYTAKASTDLSWFKRRDGGHAAIPNLNESRSEDTLVVPVHLAVTRLTFGRPGPRANPARNRYRCS